MTPTAPATQKLIHILLVEDDEIDQEACRYAFEQARIANPLHIAKDGIEALEMLRGQAGNDPFPRPYLILLDLNLPRMDGHEFLAELRADASIADSIIFVLTTSDDERDKNAAYDRQVAGYIVKSNVGEEFLRLTRMFDHYWQLVDFPPEGRRPKNA